VDNQADVGSAGLYRLRAFSQTDLYQRRHMMTTNQWLRTVGCAAALSLGLAATASGQLSQGADVVLQDPYEVWYSGTVNGINGYAYGSHTCNVGNQSLAWLSNGTPGLAMNAFRLYNGRIEQIGLSSVKHACCAAESNQCGLGCNSAGAGLGPGCRDTYWGSYNGGQGRLGPRSGINAWTGAFSALASTTGDAVFERVQIPASDMSPVNFPGAQYFIDGVYVGTDDAQAGNHNNNATYRRVTVSGTAMTLQGTPQVGKPAIYAWRDHGGGANVVDASVTIQPVDVPNEGRFFVGHKVTDLGGGQWRYDYAIYNLCSDRAGGSFRVPIKAGVTVTPGSIGFKDINYHSGEIYSNTDWTITESGGEILWSSPQTFVQNPNSNALRWGTMYNFWFTADSGPEDTEVEMGLFKPHTPNSVSFTVSAPAGELCVADFDENGTVQVPDIFSFLSAWFAGDSEADIDGVPGIGVPDIFAFLSLWFAGC
jgi:hypothetical protein